VCNAGAVTVAALASRKARLRAGVRAGIPFGVAGALLSVSFGIVAQDAGMSQIAAIVMSAIVVAGSAQFTAIAILLQGGTIAAAIGAAALINSR
jgi:predicted branched-subunit amino acid permease